MTSKSSKQMNPWSSSPAKKPLRNAKWRLKSTSINPARLVAYRWRMVSKQVLNIKILNCGGLRDLMSELEAQFLVSALGLFRNAKDFGRGKPRANVDLDRAYDAEDFYQSIFQTADIVHVIAHASANELDVGVARKRVTPAGLVREAHARSASVARVIISTGCNLQSTAWQDAFRRVGAHVLIASTDEVTPANLTAFDMAFYSALLSQVRRGTNTENRVRESFALSNSYYRGIHADGTPFAKFTLIDL